MEVSRRNFVKMLSMATLGVAAGNVLTVNGRAEANESKGDKYIVNHEQVPAYYHFKLGKMEITTLCDGMGIFTPEMCLTNLTAKEINNLADRDYMPRTAKGIATVAINAFLINTGNHLIRVDSGKGAVDGEIFTEKHGLVTEFLKASGYEPEDVDVLLPTHLHADHICGIEENGQCIFPNATLYLANQEKAYWLDSDMSSQPQEAQIAAQIARTAAKPYIAANRIKTFEPGEEVFAGIKSVPLFGHTPGHTGYMVSSEGKSLFIWGDLLHVKAVQLPHPEVGIIFDSDTAEARKRRAEMLPKLAEKKQLVCGAHLPFPGIGYLEKQGKNYHFHPIEYQLYH